MARFKSALLPVICTLGIGIIMILSSGSVVGLLFFAPLLIWEVYCTRQALTGRVDTSGLFRERIQRLALNGVVIFLTFCFDNDIIFRVVMIIYLAAMLGIKIRHALKDDGSGDVPDRKYIVTTSVFYTVLIFITFADMSFFEAGLLYFPMMFAAENILHYWQQTADVYELFFHLISTEPTVIWSVLGLLVLLIVN